MPPSRARARASARPAGGVFKTVNGGSSWSNLDTGTSANPQALLALDADRICSSGPRGFGSPPRWQLLQTVEVEGREGQAARRHRCGQRGADRIRPRTSPCRRTRARRGRRSKGRRTSELNDVDFLGASKGYALADTGELFKTSNGGDKWKVVKALNRRGTGISFSSASSGYVSVDRFGTETPGLRVPDQGRRQDVATAADRPGLGRGSGRAVDRLLDLFIHRYRGFFATTPAAERGSRPN